MRNDAYIFYIGVFLIFFIYHILHNMEQETLKQRTANSLFWSALNNGAMQVLNLVAGIFLARILSTSDYGLVGILTIFSAIATALQESGFTSALTNLEKPTANDYNSVFWFSLFVSIGCYVVLFFAAPFIASFFHHNELVWLSRFVFISLLFSAIGTAPLAYMFKNMLVKEVTILRTTALIIASVFSITLALLDFSYWSLAWQQMLYISIVSIGRFFFIPWRPSLRIDFTPVRRMFSFSYRILLTSIVNTVSQNVLTFIFARLYPISLVGNFTQAFKWNNLSSSLVSGTISQVAQPVLVELNKEQNRQIKAFHKMLKFTAFLSFPAMFGLAMISKEFIIVLISNKWADCIPMLLILCIGGAFLPFYTLYQNLAISLGRSNLYLLCTSGLIVLQLILTLLCYNQGILFIVVVYSVITILWLLVWQYFIHREMNICLFDVLFDICPYMLVSAIVMIIAYFSTIFISNLYLLLVGRILIATILYLVLMKVLGSKILAECISFFRNRIKK